MNSQEKYATLGIDIGSTTVKIAILDEEHNILFPIMSVTSPISGKLCLSSLRRLMTSWENCSCTP